ERTAGRTGGEGGRVLDAAGDPTPAGATECPGDRGDGSDGHARSTPGRAGGAEDDAPDGEAVARTPFGGVRAGRVHVDDSKVTVHVGARDGASGGSAVREGHGDLAAAQVVGIGDDAAVADDDAGAAVAPADADDGRTGARCDGADGGLQVFDDAHGSD